MKIIFPLLSMLVLLAACWKENESDKELVDLSIQTTETPKTVSVG